MLMSVSSAWAQVALGATPVHLLVGPAVAFKLSSKITGFDDILQDDNEEWESLKGTDFSLANGAGASLPTGFGEVGVWMPATAKA